MTEPRVTLPLLAERIATVDGKVSTLDAKFARVYALLGLILVAILAGIIVALVTR